MKYFFLPYTDIRIKNRKDPLCVQKQNSKKTEILRNWRILVIKVSGEGSNFQLANKSWTYIIAKSLWYLLGKTLKNKHKSNIKIFEKKVNPNIYSPAGLVTNKTPHLFFHGCYLKAVLRPTYFLLNLSCTFLFYLLYIYRHRGLKSPIQRYSRTHSPWLIKL